MIICGIKTTHDGGVALIDDGRLVFSHEMEKEGNGERYAKIGDLARVFELIREYGYRPEDVNLFALDGWHKTHKVKPWFGQEVEILLAPYRRGLINTDLMTEYHYQVLDLKYTSYHHYAGHVAAAYSTSPFAREGRDCYVMAWDGLMFPHLYHVNTDSADIADLGKVFSMIGDTYYRLAQRFKPFDGVVEFPHILGIAGKVMAFVATSKPSQNAMEHYEEIYLRACSEHGLDPDAGRDEELLDTGAAVIETMLELLDDALEPPEVMLASLQTFLQGKITAGLARLLEGQQDVNMCITGGCGLNIKWNSAVRDLEQIGEVWVPPFANDSGSALGAACCAMLLHTPHRALDWSVYSGPEVQDSEAAEGWIAEECTVEQLAAELHETGRPVVVLQGRAETGPRALGHRSLLAPATDPRMKDHLNDIKDREGYRPVAPVCLESEASEIFAPGGRDPYMLFEHMFRGDWARRVPAVVHLDGSARLQTVSAKDDDFLYELLTSYYEKSGIPVLCNTSANYNRCGFFPDVRSAMEWGGADAVWSNGLLYRRAEVTA